MEHDLSGNPAVMGLAPCRPVILRHRFSAVLPLQKRALVQGPSK
jgi:hypothetical protein